MNDKTLSLIFNLKSQALNEDTIQDCKDLDFDVARIYEQMSANTLISALCAFKEDYRKIAVACDRDQLELFGEGILEVGNKLYEECNILEVVDPDDLLGYSFREGFEKEATRQGLTDHFTNFQIVTLLTFYLEKEYIKELGKDDNGLLVETQNSREVAKLMNQVFNEFKKEPAYKKYMSEISSILENFRNKQGDEGVRDATIAAATEYVNTLAKKAKSGKQAEAQKLINEVWNTDWKISKEGIKIYIQKHSQGEMPFKANDANQGSNKMDWLKYLSCPNLDNEGFANIYLVPVNLPMVQAAETLSKIDTTNNRYIFLGTTSNNFKGNSSVGTILTGNQCLELYRVWFKVPNDSKLITAYNFGSNEENQGGGFQDELQNLLVKWQNETNNKSIKLKLHYNQTLASALKWLGSFDFYDSVSETVIDNTFEPFPKSSLVQNFMKIFEQILQQISNPKLEERAKYTAYDFFELEAQELLKKKDKEKTKESSNRKSWLDRYFEAEEVTGTTEDGVDFTVRDADDPNSSSKPSEEAPKQDPKDKPKDPKEEEEAKKAEEEKAKLVEKWTKVQQWYKEHKECRWAAKLLAIIYTNWKNPSVYNESGIDDKKALSILSKLIREEDKELAEEFVNQMGGGLFLALGKQLKDIADEAAKQKDAEKSAENLLADHKNDSEEAKMIARLGTHKHFANLFNEKNGGFDDDVVSSTQFFDKLS